MESDVRMSRAPDEEREYFENGDVKLEVRRFPSGDGEFVDYVLEVGGAAYLLLQEKQWGELRELLEAYWQQEDEDV
jgi:hypothetical protein